MSTTPRSMPGKRTLHYPTFAVAHDRLRPDPHANGRHPNEIVDRLRHAGSNPVMSSSATDDRTHMLRAPAPVPQSVVEAEQTRWSGARDSNPGPHGPEPC